MKRVSILIVLFRIVLLLVLLEIRLRAVHDLQVRRCDEMDEKGIAGPNFNPSLIADRYRVEKTLGEGGMAVVYEVLDLQTGQKLALKRLTVIDNPEKLAEIAKYFEREFHTLVQPAHPNVIEVYDFGKDESGPYYTMELLDGGDLRERAPVPWRTACSLFIQVCSVLGLLHSRRQLHRDVTPRNIRCTRDAKAKLIDFGAVSPMGPCKQVKVLHVSETNE
ncbi:MAG: serine/threonine protein kinase [Deltaproteobacteria bacterium]|nr:serine/threonine protein kinase [Deltaproteobacteria bacterium]